MIDNIINKVVSLLNAHSIDPKEFCTALLAFYDETEKKVKEAEKVKKQAEKEEQKQIVEALAKVEKEESDYLVWGKFFGFSNVDDFNSWKSANAKEYDSYAPALAKFLEDGKPKADPIEEPTAPVEDVKTEAETPTENR